MFAVFLLITYLVPLAFAAIRRSPTPPLANSPSGARAQKIGALTSLRFFAALYVVLKHSIYWGFPHLQPGTLAARAASIGYVSVSFFFLLSGYILAVVYLRSDREVDAKKFYAARFARIYPLYFLMLVLDTPHLLLPRIASYGLKAGILKTAVTFVSSSLMLQSLSPVLLGINDPGWSLSVEAFFYLAFPFLGVFLWKWRGWGLKVGALLIYLSAMALVGLALPHMSETSVARFPILNIGTFTLGILLARWQQEQREATENLERPRMRIYAVLLIAAAAYCAVVYLTTYTLDGSVQIRLGVFLSNGMLAPIFAAVIWAFSLEQTRVARLFSVKWLVILGEASYGLYLIHIPVLELSMWLHLDRNPALYPIYLGLIIALSVLSFYLLETPARKWILKRGAVRPRATMELASDAQ